MTQTFEHEPGNGLAHEELPAYAAMLAAYHRSRDAELRAIVATLPLTPQSSVLDVASGDGYFSRVLAECAGSVVGVDLSTAFIELARHQSAAFGNVSFQQAEVGALGFADNCFDVVWCAQSLFSLPDPITSLREMARVAKPGGYVAILENDSLHHLIMPWPAELELAVRQAQLRALTARNAARGADKFYIGRDLAGLLIQASLLVHSVRTFAVERHAPLSDDETLFLREHLAEVRCVADPHLDPASRRAFDILFNADSSLYLLAQPNFHLTHLEMLAVGKKG